MLTPSRQTQNKAARHFSNITCSRSRRIPFHVHMWCNKIRFENSNGSTTLTIQRKFSIPSGNDICSYRFNSYHQFISFPLVLTSISVLNAMVFWPETVELKWAEQILCTQIGLRNYASRCKTRSSYIISTDIPESIGVVVFNLSYHKTGSYNYNKATIDGTKGA